MHSFPSLYSKLLKGSTAIVLTAFLVSPSYGMDDEMLTRCVSSAQTVPSSDWKWQPNNYAAVNNNGSYRFRNLEDEKKIELDTKSNYRDFQAKTSSIATKDSPLVRLNLELGVNGKAEFQALNEYKDILQTLTLVGKDKNKLNARQMDVGVPPGTKSIYFQIIDGNTESQLVIKNSTITRIPHYPLKITGMEAEVKPLESDSGFSFLCTDPQKLDHFFRKV